MRWKSWKAWLGLVAILVMAVGCGASSGAQPYERAKNGRSAAMSPDGFALPAGGGGLMTGGEMIAEGDAGGEAPDDAPPTQAPLPMKGKDKPEPPPTAHDGTSTQPAGPLLIYTANYTMAVFEVVQSIDAVQALASKMGGYLVKRDNRSITVRVPAKKYADALEGIAKLGDVLNREETVEDVTEKFFDLKTRLDNARAMRVRLQELLAAAKDVREALAVEKELARVTETIERLEGKLKRLRELINFSTITVTFSAHNSENVNSKVRLPFPWLNALGLGPLLQLQ